MAHIRVKRGLEANRTGFTPLTGELIWTTDEKKLYVGDGSTAGGISILSGTIPYAEKGVADGIATLDSNGKIPTTQMPAISLTDVNTVVDEASQLALDAQEGDVAIRSDEGKSYIHNGGTAGDMTDWTEIKSPSGGSTFLSLSDTPSAYAGAGFFAITNGGNNAIEFTDTIDGGTF